MRGRFLFCLFLLVPHVAASEGPVRYVADRLVIVMREAPSGSSPALGTLETGARMTLLDAEVDGGFVKVRLDGGRVGWVPERYLDRGPPAALRLREVEASLARAEAELKVLRDERTALTEELARVSAGRGPMPPEELREELSQLRSRAIAAEARVAELEESSGVAEAEQRMLLLGGTLVSAGFILAWLVRLMWPRRRWGEL